MGVALLVYKCRRSKKNSSFSSSAAAAWKAYKELTSVPAQDILLKTVPTGSCRQGTGTYRKATVELHRTIDVATVAAARRGPVRTLSASNVVSRLSMSLSSFKASKITAAGFMRPQLSGMDPSNRGVRPGSANGESATSPRGLHALVAARQSNGAATAAEATAAEDDGVGALPLPLPPLQNLFNKTSMLLALTR